nr:vegetative cell wall protein gp1-like [Lolium perenne]
MASSPPRPSPSASSPPRPPPPWDSSPTPGWPQPRLLLHHNVPSRSRGLGLAGAITYVLATVTASPSRVRAKLAAPSACSNSRAAAHGQRQELLACIRAAAMQAKRTSQLCRRARGQTARSIISPMRPGRILLVRPAPMRRPRPPPATSTVSCAVLRGKQHAANAALEAANSRHACACTSWPNQTATPQRSGTQQQQQPAHLHPRPAQSRRAAPPRAPAAPPVPPAAAVPAAAPLLLCALRVLRHAPASTAAVHCAPLAPCPGRLHPRPAPCHTRPFRPRSTTPRPARHRHGLHPPTRAQEPPSASSCHLARASSRCTTGFSCDAPSPATPPRRLLRPPPPTAPAALPRPTRSPDLDRMRVATTGCTARSPLASARNPGRLRRLAVANAPAPSPSSGSSPMPGPAPACHFLRLLRTRARRPPRPSPAAAPSRASGCAPTTNSGCASPPPGRLPRR